MSRESRIRPSRFWISLAEALLGAFIVIGHNVYRIVPNEVPILVVLGWVSFRLRDGSWCWQAGGLKKPTSWFKTVLLAFAAAVALQLASALIADPISGMFWHRAPDLSSFKRLVGNTNEALNALLLVWTFAAFGEELGYRAYLMKRFSEVFGDSKLSGWLALLPVAILFGFGHFYQGPAGVVDAISAGLVLGSAYLLSGRNLWVTILAHGISDTFAVAAVYYGWASNTG